MFQIQFMGKNYIQILYYCHVFGDVRDLQTGFELSYWIY
jgi:hypothetical protein